jgi:hypothetical protein
MGKFMAHSQNIFRIVIFKNFVFISLNGTYNLLILFPNYMGQKCCSDMPNQAYINEPSRDKTKVKVKLNEPTLLPAVLLV